MKKLILLFSLCSTVLLATAKDDLPKYVQNWKLKNMNGKSVDGQCNLKIDMNGQFSGSGFCNNYAGNFTFDGKKKVSTNPNMISTKKMCEGNMQEETEYFATLPKITGYKIDKDKLYMMAEKEIILEYERVADTTTKGKKKK